MKVKEVDIKDKKEWDDSNDETQMLKMHIIMGLTPTSSPITEPTE